MSSDWVEFWDSKNSLFVDARHEAAHFRRIAEDIRDYAPEGGNGVMLDFGVEKLFRDAAIFLHMDATADISKLKIIKSMFPATAGKYAGPE